MKNRTLLKTILTIMITSSMLACATKKKGTLQNEASQPVKIDISLNITFTSNYCGGVAPSDDMIAKLKAPRKFSNQNFYISKTKGLEEGMKEVTTSAAGIATTALEKGVYFVFLPQKVSAKHSGRDRSEKDCETWKNTPNGTFTVGDGNSISFNIHKTCDGCGAFRM